MIENIMYLGIELIYIFIINKKIKEYKNWKDQLSF